MSSQVDFMVCVREALAKELEKASLVLLDLDLSEDGSSRVVVPGSERYVLTGRVGHPLTKGVKAFSTRFGGQIGETKPEDVVEMVNAIAESMVEAFYPAGPGVH